MEKIIDRIHWYVSGVIDLFDDGVFSLVLLLILVVVLAGFFAWFKAEEWIYDSSDKIVDKIKNLNIPIFWRIVIGILCVAAVIAAFSFLDEIFKAISLKIFDWFVDFIDWFVDFMYWLGGLIFDDIE